MQPRRELGRSEARRPAPSAARCSGFRDPLSLLSRAVSHLRESTRSERVVAWTRRDDGRPYVAAAAYAGEPPAEPEPAEFAALAALPGAAALRAESQGRVREIARRHACAAAVPLAENGEAFAVLLVGGDAGPVRPRTLAELDAAARQLAGPLATARDLARLRDLDHEVRHLDRLAALGGLATEIAHEVRNALVAVKTFLQLQPEGDGSESSSQFRGVVEDELRRMERLLDLVIEHGRPEDEGEAACAPPGAVLDSVAALLRHRAARRGVALEVEAPTGLPDVALGEDALRQVVLNLALNALEVTPAGGSVRLCCAAAGDAVQVAVVDEGPGISDELRARVFEPFYSTHRDRAGGLGLAITRRIVEDAGGVVSVVDGARVGSEFRVRLPAATS